MYVGETLTIRVRGTDPVTQGVIDDAAVTAYLYAPPKNPSTVPGDRTPDHTVALSFDEVSRYYLGSVSTTGFPPGTWWVQGAVAGGARNYDAFAYSSFQLNP